MADIANEDLTVNFSSTAGPGDLVYSADQGIDAVKIVPVKATKAKANNKLLCLASITLTFAVATPCPFTSATYNFVSGSGSISATAQKTKADSQAVLMKDDTGACAGSWTRKASPFTAMPCACNIKIADAGQDKVGGG